MKSTFVRSADAQERWLLYDASEHNLGRMAAKIAMNLMGKDSPNYQPSELNGAFVIVINAQQVRTTGRKNEVKTYAHYSGYPGGHKEVAFEDLRERRADEIIRLAVKRMLPKTVQGRNMLRRLKVYADGNHEHQAQMPKNVETIR